MVDTPEQQPVKPADAFGALKQRGAQSRMIVLVLMLVGFAALVFLGVTLFRGLGQDSIPKVPQVEL